MRGAQKLYVWVCALQDIVIGLFPTRIASFSRAVAAQKAQLLPYLIAVRMAPVLPSWFVNLAAPILQVLYNDQSCIRLIPVSQRCVGGSMDLPFLPSHEQPITLYRSIAREQRVEYPAPSAFVTPVSILADPLQLLCHLHSNRAAAHKHSVGPSWRILEQSSLMEGLMGGAQHPVAGVVPAGCPPACSCAQALAQA